MTKKYFKKILTLLIAVLIINANFHMGLILSQSNVYADNLVKHDTKNQVINKIKKLMSEVSIEITPEQLLKLRENEPNIKQVQKEITLHSDGGDEYQTATLQLRDTSTGKIINDVKWYGHLQYPETYFVATEQGEVISKPDKTNNQEHRIAYIKNNGEIKTLDYAGQSDSFNVWAEYNHALFRFVVKVVPHSKTKDMLAEKKADQIIAEKNWDKLDTKAEKALAVYEYLTQTITYDKNYLLHSYLYGAIIEKKAVCNGYAKAFQLFASKLGMKSTYIGGKVSNGTQPHAWVIVKLDDDQWYYVDPTWGDTEFKATNEPELVDYTFFLQTRDQFNQTHNASSKLDVNGYKYNFLYYKKNALVVEDIKNLHAVLEKFNSTNDKINLSFAILSTIDETEVEKIINTKWHTNYKINKTPSHGVRLGGINKHYKLQEYSLSKPVVVNDNTINKTTDAAIKAPVPEKETKQNSEKEKNSENKTSSQTTTSAAIQAPANEEDTKPITEKETPSENDTPNKTTTEPDSETSTTKEGSKPSPKKEATPPSNTELSSTKGNSKDDTTTKTKTSASSNAKNHTSVDTVNNYSAKTSTDTKQLNDDTVKTPLKDTVSSIKILLSKPDLKIEEVLNINYKKSFIKGNNNKFRPDDSISRAELLTILDKLFIYQNNSTNKYPNAFNDCTDDAWYTDTIGFMSAIDLVSGYPDGSFRPNNPITRAEFASLLYKLDKNVNVIKSDFKDISNEHWAKNPIDYIATKNLIIGYDDNTYRPETCLTRAEAVVIINRILNRSIPKEGITSKQSELLVFDDVSKNHWAYYDILSASNDVQ